MGSGVSGLTAAWVLQRVADVTLYEADDRLGGHADTHDVIRGAGSIAVDTGFIVHNERTYPTLLRLFAALGVTTRATEMSMSVHCSGCGLEYAGARGARGLFPAASNLRRPYLRMLTEVPRFHRDARALLRRPAAAAEPTLRQFAAAHGYSEYFRTHFLVPMVAAVWSCAPGSALDYPARYLFAFLANHGLLSVTGSPRWRTVVGGSRSYVEAAAKELSAVATATPVRRLTRTADGVEIRDDADTVAHFQGAVVATHPDQALRLLAAPSRAESEVLGAFGYSVNHAVLHTDPSPLPRAGGARASWNYRLADCTAEPDRVGVSYDMNRLQGLPGPEHYVVSLNDAGAIDPAKVLARMVYEHPIYTPESVAAQRRLPELSDERVAFAGAYHGWGFHEDGAASGLRAALALGGRW
ncbi:MAG TPA: FAD-dependent oxidoreductase [Sporichthyaceae bacterium]|nr:FAD-dependent oxidoreductase [Sporichthyaceae bacterium]